jgi:hypothetical protein
VEHVLEDMRRFGFDETEIAKARAELSPQVVDPIFQIHPDNVAAVKMLIAASTQWRTVPLSTMQKAIFVRTGLDYAAVEVTGRMTGLALTPDDFGRLRVLEAGCLDAWAEERRLGR